MIAGSSAQPPTDVTHFDSNKVAAAFAKGMPLLETNNFKIHASRRDAAGIAELHERDTDIFYVLDGSAIFVTGGKVAEAKTIAPNEIRGPRLEGGATRRLSKGDIIVVPNGVPHWFKEVENTLVYYVVKVSK
jgi:glc operon protein GlcG